MFGELQAWDALRQIWLADAVAAGEGLIGAFRPWRLCLGLSPAE